MGAVWVTYQKRHAAAFAVRHRALAAQPVHAQQFAVIGHEHDDGAIGLPSRIERLQDLIQVAVGVADAVVVVVLELAPDLGVVEGQHAEGHFHRACVLAHCFGPALQRRRPVVGQHLVAEVAGVERIVGGRARQRVGKVHLARLGHRIACGVVHDVVRVQQVDGAEPGLVGALP